MASKLVSALAAGAMLVATSSAFAQTANSPSVNTAALLQSGAGESEATTWLIIGGVLVAIGLVVWAGGDDDDQGAPVSP
ncbi:hypothetical protein [Sphingosinicella humi]|uniref:LPXTG cell wall anchor domain-containing protein n=1 Tax=Allosphingosinicella humi TaxID=2068657 RepID=A0A2U2J1Z2_9SPHN|nr:hypothetical protein [Sphingosinicella humi]PWG02359.1 hypothetical protein DF286_05395 [Sphingosinicella humi]